MVRVSKKRNWKVISRNTHRWLSIIIGVQLFLWTFSGVYFAWVSIRTVRGEDRAEISVPKREFSDGSRWVHPSKILEDHGTDGIEEIRISKLRNKVVYQLINEDGIPVEVFDAQTGDPIPHVEPTEAAYWAKLDYGEAFKLKGVNLLDDPPGEFRGPSPVFQVQVDDFRKTRLYVSPLTGKILARRNRFWRVYDFLWMLHIMDFRERENFNNILLKIVALGGLSVVLSGYWLWWISRRKPRKTQ